MCPQELQLWQHVLNKSLSEAEALEILFQGSFYSAQAFMEVYFGCPNNCRSIEGRCDNFSHLLYACVIVVRAIELSQLKAFRHDKSCIQFTIMFLASEFSTPLLLNNVTQKNPPFHSIVGPLLVMFSWISLHDGLFRSYYFVLGKSVQNNLRPWNMQTEVTLAN